MRSKHTNILFGTFLYILGVARIVTVQKCRTVASRPITFSTKSEEEMNETRLM